MIGMAISKAVVDIPHKIGPPYFQIGVAYFFIPLYVAIKCNPNDAFIYGLAAFLFPEIYIVQFVIRKYMLKQSGYCSYF